MEIWLSSMDNRYKIPKQSQIRYFQNVEKESKLTPTQLAKLFGIVPRTYCDWRRGKFSIPEHVTTLVEQKFHITPSIEKKVALRHWFNIKHSASVKGGRILFEKRGNPATTEGRILGGTRALTILRASGRIPPEKPFNEPKTHTKELAEFVGILLGDGHIGQSQWSITLNSIKDAKYAKFVQRLVYDLFLFYPTKRKRKHKHAVVIYGGGKRIINYFQKLGLHIGNKIEQQVGIPLWIEQDKNYCVACLRGLIDTDGGIFLHSYKVNGKTYSYIKLCFANKSIPLINFVYRTLSMLQLQPKLRMNSDTKRVWIYDVKYVEKYVHVVKPSNTRLLQYFGG
jgi:hypothetical protein